MAASTVQTGTDLAAEVRRLEAELRTFAVLRDNFHDLYRQEREARVAAERLAESCAAERDRLEAEVRTLHTRLHTARSALARHAEPRPTTVELRGGAAQPWIPRVVEGH